jgi:hypothetical protein
MVSKINHIVMALVIGSSLGLHAHDEQDAVQQPAEQWLTQLSHEIKRAKRIATDECLTAKNFQLLSDYSYIGALGLYLAYCAHNNVVIPSKKGGLKLLIAAGLAIIAKKAFAELAEKTSILESEEMPCPACEAQQPVGVAIIADVQQEQSTEAVDAMPKDGASCDIETKVIDIQAESVEQIAVVTEQQAEPQVTRTVEVTEEAIVQEHVETNVQADASISTDSL